MRAERGDGRKRYKEVWFTPFGWWYWDNRYLGRGKMPEDPATPEFRQAVEDNLHYTLRVMLGCFGNDQNVCLTFPPAPDGSVPPLFEAILRRVGDWMKVHGEGVYGTRGGPWVQHSPKWHYFAHQPPNHPNEADLFRYHLTSTCKGDRVFLYLYLKPGQEHRVSLPKLPVKVLDAKFKNGHLAAFEQTGSEVVFTVPKEEVVPYVTAIDVTLAGPALGFPMIEVPLLAQAEGTKTVTPQPAAAPSPAAAGDTKAFRALSNVEVALSEPDAIKRFYAADAGDTARLEWAIGDGGAVFVRSDLKSGGYQAKPWESLPPDFHYGLAADRQMITGHLGQPDADPLPPKTKEGVSMKSWTYARAKGKELDTLRVIRFFFDADGRQIGHHTLQWQPPKEEKQ